jgi:hypothetical protein
MSEDEIYFAEITTIRSDDDRLTSVLQPTAAGGIMSRRG